MPDPDRPLLLVLADERDDEDFALLLPALERHGVRAVRRDPRTLDVRLQGGTVRIADEHGDLEPSLVLGWVLEEVLDPGMVVLELAAEAGVPVLNDARTLYRAAHKLLDAVRLARAGVGARTACFSRRPDHLEAWRREGGGDVVIRPVRGYGGRGVVRLRGPEDLERWEADREPSPDGWIATPRLEIGGHDVRVYTVNHHAVLAMDRYAEKGSQVTNVLAGGSIATHPLTPELIACAETASRAAGTPLGGVDIGRDERTGELEVFEVNACPSLEPVVIEEAASFLAAAARDLPRAQRTWTPSRVLRERDDDPRLFHPRKRHLLRDGG